MLAPNGGNSLAFGTSDSLLMVNSQTLTLGGTMPSVPSAQSRGVSTMSNSTLVLVDGGTTGDMGTVPFEAAVMDVRPEPDGESHRRRGKRDARLRYDRSWHAHTYFRHAHYWWIWAAN